MGWDDTWIFLKMRCDTLKKKYVEKSPFFELATDYRTLSKKSSSSSSSRMQERITTWEMWDREFKARF